MRKLILEKEVISKLNEAKMKSIKGGMENIQADTIGQEQLFNTHVVCLTIKKKGCRTQNSCTKIACF